MDTVTATNATRPELGSIEDYVETIRNNNLLDFRSTYVDFTGFARWILSPAASTYADTEKLAFLRNALAAADQVREELDERAAAAR